MLASLCGRRNVDRLQADADAAKGNRDWQIDPAACIFTKPESGGGGVVVTGSG